MTVFILYLRMDSALIPLGDSQTGLGLGTPKVVPKVPETGRGWLGLSAMS